LGKSIEYTIRFNNYDKFSEIYVLYYVEDIDFIEDILIQIFKRKFTHEDMYGKEYFSGAINDMLKTMEHIINGYGFIEKKDLFDIWIQDKLKRFIIYNDDHINTFMYEIINDIMNENDIENIDINDVTNYNQFYNTYVMNNKNLYNNIKSKKNVKKDENKIRLKTDIQNYNEINKVEELNNIIKNDLSETELNETNFNEDDLTKSELNENDLTESQFNKNEFNEIEFNETEFKQYIVKQIVYICHHCIDYKTKNKNDMEKHFNRKKECICNNTSLSYEECKELSINKRYYFYFDIFNLRQSDFIEIITQYNDKENHIYKNDTNKIIINKEAKNNKTMDKFDKLYYNNITGKYKCIVCSNEYTSKQNMKKHILNQEKCNINKEINDIIELHKSIKK
jgi:uncharacterized protein YjbI with pentapeptide repeats